jgi:general nucleoside transport system permease protein
VTVAAPPFDRDRTIARVGGQRRLRLWLQIGFWLAIAAILLALTGAQFGPAATISILAITITKATPITLGALAGICSERTGVVNIGIEGMMLTAAFAGFMAGVYTHNLSIAVVAAITSGALMAALHAVLSITFRVDQIISGTVVNILAVGLTGYLNRQLFATGAPAGLSVLPSLPFGPLNDLPWIGPIVFQQKPIALTAIALVVVLHLALFRTRWGLRTRAVGEHPLAADTVGVSVNKLRYRNVVIGGAMAGLAGAYFTLESVPHFEPLMTNGRGFIALAAMIFGKWTPFGAWGAALLFGVAEAIPTAMQLQRIEIPFQIVGLLPYVLTIVVVAGAVGRATPPAADGVPYVRA